MGGTDASLGPVQVFKLRVYSSLRLAKLSVDVLLSTTWCPAL
jgi:hypothetical protein